MKRAAAPISDERRGRMAALPRQRAHRVVTTALFFCGAVLCFPYLLTSFGPVAIVAAALAWAISFITAERARSRTVRWLAGAFSAVLYAGTIYATVLFT